MADFGRLWAGNVFGTNTGTLFVELESTPAGVSGILRMMDHAFGLVVYEVQGNFVGGTLELEGDPKQADPEIETGRITAKAILTPQGTLRGQWNSTLGTAGTFLLFPHDPPQADPSKWIDTPIPEQLHTTRQTVGAVRLYKEDVHELAQVIRKDFSVGRLIATYKQTGVENTRYFDEFAEEAKDHGEIQYLKLSIQEPEAHGINKLVMIELNSQSRNDIIVQGIYESWIIGKAETIVRQLRRHEKSLVTNINKFGLGFYQLIVVAMLVLFPEVEPLWRRGVFAVVVLGLVLGLVWAHWRFLPNVVVSMSSRRSSALARAWPVILSWMITTTASLAAALVFYLLTQPTGLSSLLP